MTNTPASIALAQFKRRQASPVPAHDARLRPWAALALRAGSDLSALPPDVQGAVEDYRKAELTDREARACVAADLCPLSAMLAELAHARDAALDNVPAPNAPEFSRRSQAAQDLQVLAAHLGAPGYRCPSLKEAA